MKLTNYLSWGDGVTLDKAVRFITLSVASKITDDWTSRIKQRIVLNDKTELEYIQNNDYVRHYHFKGITDISIIS